MRCDAWDRQVSNQIDTPEQTDCRLATISSASSTRTAARGVRRVLNAEGKKANADVLRIELTGTRRRALLASSFGNPTISTLRSTCALAHLE